MFLLLALAMSKGSRLATVDYAYSKKEMDKKLNGEYVYFITKEEGKCFKEYGTDDWQLEDPPAAKTYTLNVTFIGRGGEVLKESIVVVNGKVKSCLAKCDDKYYFNPDDFTFYMRREDVSDFDAISGKSACIDAMYSVEKAGFLVDYYKKDEADDKFLSKEVYEEIEIEDGCVDVSSTTNFKEFKNPIDVSNIDSFEIVIKSVKKDGTTSYISRVIESEKTADDNIGDNDLFSISYRDKKINYLYLNRGSFSDYNSICIESIRYVNKLNYLPRDKVVGNIDDYKEDDVFSASAADERYARKVKAFTTSSFTYDLAGAFVQVAAEVKGDTALGVVFEGVIDFDDNRSFSIDINEEYKLLIAADSDNNVQIKLNKEEEKLAFGHLIIY